MHHAFCRKPSMQTLNASSHNALSLLVEMLACLLASCLLHACFMLASCVLFEQNQATRASENAVNTVTWSVMPGQAHWTPGSGVVNGTTWLNPGQHDTSICNRPSNFKYLSSFIHLKVLEVWRSAPNITKLYIYISLPDMWYIWSAAGWFNKYWDKAPLSKSLLLQSLLRFVMICLHLYLDFVPTGIYVEIYRHLSSLV
jgi:hypothetical protein